MKKLGPEYRYKNMTFIVAIDGAAGTGKGTIEREFQKNLIFLILILEQSIEV